MDLMKGMPKICVPIMGHTEEELINTAERLANSVADIIEWRGDYFEQLRDNQALRETARKLKEVLGEKPILFTIRTAGEGGTIAIGFEEYAQVLTEVAKISEIDFVDVEALREDTSQEKIEKLIALLKENVTVIGSYHNFQKTLEQQEITRRLCLIHEIGADVPKMALMPKDKSDVLTLMAGTLAASEKLPGVPLITMSMGALGAISRVAGENFGSRVTFGCDQEASAPGQIEMNELYKMLTTLHFEKGE